MPTRKTKNSPKPAKKLVRRSKTSTKSLKPAAAKSRKLQPLDLSAFPPESISVSEKQICLACVLDIFTRHLGLTARTAHLEIKKYTPSLAELYAPATTRPWFIHQPDRTGCPYCG